MKRKGTEIILEALKRQGVRQVFGYPGGCVIPLFDEFLNHSDIRLIRVAHEQAAAHAADGYARVSGEPGVGIVTSGTGATNTITWSKTWISFPVFCKRPSTLPSPAGPARC